MTDFEKDFIENFNDYLQPIPQEIINLTKLKIWNKRWYELIMYRDKVDESIIREYHFYATLPKHDVKEPEVCWNEEHRDALERYVNYLKVLIKTEGFKSSDY